VLYVFVGVTCSFCVNAQLCELLGKIARRAYFLTIIDDTVFLQCCKTVFFSRCFLILRFSYVENLLHFNLADFPVVLIKQHVSCFFWYLYHLGSYQKAHLWNKKQYFRLEHNANNCYLQIQYSQARYVFHVICNSIKLLKQILLSKFLSYCPLRTTKNIAYHVTELLEISKCVPWLS